MGNDSAVQEPEAHTPPQGEAAPSIETAVDRPLNRTQAMGFGLAPRNFDEAWRMADVFSKTKLVPNVYQGKPHDILVAMQYGAELGLPPMASLQSVAVINGKPGVYGDGFLAIIQSTPAYAKHKEFYVLATGDQVRSLRQEDYQHDETKAVSMFWRKGNPEPFVAEFSIGDAKRAKLWGKEGPWTNYPSRQLLWRARGYAGRNGFAAELRGIKTAEELLDTPTDIVTETIDLPPAEPVRRSEKAALAADATAPLADEPAAAEATRVEGTPAGPSNASTKSAPEKPAAPGQIAKGLRITNTLVVPGKDDKPGHFEIHGNKGEAGKVGLDLVFVTRDDQLYRMAASCEGSDSLFNLTWHSAKDDKGKLLKVVTGIQSAN